MTTAELNAVRPNLTQELCAVVRSIESGPARRTPAPPAAPSDRSIDRRLDRIDETLSSIALHLHGTLAAKLDSLARLDDLKRRAGDADGIVIRKLDELTRTVSELSVSDRVAAIERTAAHLSGDMTRLAEDLPHRVSDAVMRSGELVLKSAGSLWSDVDTIRRTAQLTEDKTKELAVAIETMGGSVERLLAEVASSNSIAEQMPGRFSQVEATLERLEARQRTLSEALDCQSTSSDISKVVDRIETVDERLNQIADAQTFAHAAHERIADGLQSLAAIETAVSQIINDDIAQTWRAGVSSRLDRLAEEIAETRRISTVPPQEFDAANTGFQRLTTGFRVVLRQLSDDATSLRDLVHAASQPSPPKPDADRLAAMEQSLFELRGAEPIKELLLPVLDRLLKIEKMLISLAEDGDSDAGRAPEGTGFAGAMAAAPPLNLAQTSVQQLLTGFRFILRQIGEDAHAFGDVVRRLPDPNTLFQTAASCKSSSSQELAELRERVDLVLEKVQSSGLDASLTKALQALGPRLDQWGERTEKPRDFAELPLFEPERGQLQRLVVGFAQLVQAANAEVEKLKSVNRSLAAPPSPDSGVIEDLARQVSLLKSEMGPQLATIAAQLSSGHAVLADLHALTTQSLSGGVSNTGSAGVDRLCYQLDTAVQTIDGTMSQLSKQLDHLLETGISAAGAPVDLTRDLGAFEQARRQITTKVDEFVAVAAAISEQLEQFPAASADLGK